jgi:hypothetical protein
VNHDTRKADPSRVRDFATFAGRCFQDLNPQTDLAINWHLEVIAAKLTAVREGKIRRLSAELRDRCG